MVIALVALPLLVIAVGEAVRADDGDLLEMAASFELSRWTTLRHVVAPGVASPVLAATSVTVGQAMRVSVMAELLAAADGVGAQVARARTNLATADLFAWAIALIAVVIVIDVGGAATVDRARAALAPDDRRVSTQPSCTDASGADVAGADAMTRGGCHGGSTDQSVDRSGRGARRRPHAGPLAAGPHGQAGAATGWAGVDPGAARTAGRDQ
jgi:hypothetical protein